ncbi:transcriptional regulator [Sphaerochaeta pleomorpha str. Grapes]|uniref:Transcriptional regulator n=1 Tax=Sphaerochaeta pleomorpha (strain ATCC BAA-1885 / DSM 22778 / Grapes) TaxID=158190 RepID=G8QT01_SPHPG|nr:LacI family DNA-binding transcriptional regulator [Sphaerochaeta pleomorpha]AEV27906.1 transcriptional regulator [Sphaerochaeta pleomorpha str. Grapes]
MTPTRNQVAEKAKVSSATVSRVFNKSGSVSPQLRDAVLAAAKELGYTPNKAAGMLRRRGTGVIAFVEIKKGARPYYWGNLSSFDWFFGRALRGIQEAVKESSWQLRFYSVSSKQELVALCNQCDGILAYDVDTIAEAQLFEGLPIPYVLAHHLEDYHDQHCIYTDNVLGGKLQGKFLQERGCVSPLYITGYTDSVMAHKHRLEGFLSVFPKAEILNSEVGSEHAIDGILSFVKEKVSRKEIDSIAAVNDLTLFELLLKMPCSLPSVGYDASPFYRLFSGPVASVDIQSGELYKVACRQLVSVLNGGEVKRLSIEPKLVLLGKQRDYV